MQWVTNKCWPTCLHVKQGKDTEVDCLLSTQHYTHTILRSGKLHPPTSLPCFILDRISLWEEVTWGLDSRREVKVIIFWCGGNQTHRQAWESQQHLKQACRTTHIIVADGRHLHKLPWLSFSALDFPWQFSDLPSPIYKWNLETICGIDIVGLISPSHPRLTRLVVVRFRELPESGTHLE